MKKSIAFICAVGIMSAVYLNLQKSEEVTFVEIQMPWFGNVADCYFPRDWLMNEDDGGVWTIIEQPDNGGLTSADVATDNPCVPVNDCGPYEFEYCVECDSCEDLKDCIRVSWDIPCCPPDPEPICI